jgi:predicted regulator of Ras-like GTPase activity (Roadblock/LC7/MglB family)
MARGFLFIASASEDTYLAATASPDCDMGLVWYEMALFVERFGNTFARTGL